MLELKSVGVLICPFSWRTARVMWVLYQEGERIKRGKEKVLKKN